jgi:phenylalanyl-tRNA synthetase alpha chain
MEDLSKQEWHPINVVINKIINSDFFKWFDHVEVPQVVWEWETFDLFNFPEDHVARRPSDSYFLNKSNDKKNSMLLRPHTSVMWYHYLLNQWWLEKLKKEDDIKALSWWKVYRVDELDKTHHECFHQIDGLRITRKDKEIINQDTLKEVLANTIKSIFWDIEYRFNTDTFPYTTDSLEVEVMYNGKWLEVLWAWVVHPNVLVKLWLNSEEYNGWAFGFWIERLAMAMKQVPDIRIFWSNDKRIKKQWWDLNPYKEVSNYPPVYKDISFITPKNTFVRDLEEEKKSWELELTNDTEANLFALSWIIRDLSWDLIEEVKIIDIYENNTKFWENDKSVTIKIVFRSIERTLTDDEINKIYFEIRSKMESDLWYELR